ncbi:MAG: alpha/beta hydrolase [Bacteroidales bacterium]
MNAIAFMPDIKYVRSTGSNPVLLLHGFMEDNSVWEPLMPWLGEFDLTRIDMPGHGQSPAAPDWNMQHLARSLEKIILQTFNGPAVVIGHSMGGYAALSLLAHSPDLVKGVVLLHSHAIADSPEARNNRLRTISIIEQERTSFITSFFPSLFAAQNRNRLANIIEKLKQNSQTISSESIIAALKAMMERPDSRDVLQKESVPLLTIWGRDDEKVSEEAVLETLKASPHSEMLALAGTGHMGMFEAPEKIGPVIRDFIKRCHS